MKKIIFILIGILLFIIFNNFDGFSYCQNPFRDTMGNNDNNVQLLNKGTYPILLKDNNILKWTNSPRPENDIINTKDQINLPNLSELQVQCNPGDDINAKWNEIPRDTNYNTSFTCKSPSYYKACIMAHGGFASDYMQIIPYNMQFFTYLNNEDCYGWEWKKNIHYTQVIINKIFEGNFNTYYNKYDYDNIARLVLDYPDLQNYFNRNDLFTDITIILNGVNTSVSNLVKPLLPNFGKVFSENENLNGNLIYTDDYHTSIMLNTNLFTNLENIKFEYNNSINKFNLYIPNNIDNDEYRTYNLSQIKSTFIPLKCGPYCMNISGIIFTKNSNYEIFYDMNNPNFVDIQNLFHIDLKFTEIIIHDDYELNKYEVTCNFIPDERYHNIDDLKQKFIDIIDFYIKDMSVDIRLLDLICPVPKFNDIGYFFSNFFDVDYLNGFESLERLYPGVNFENIRTFSGENIMEIPGITNICQVPLFCLNAYQLDFKNVDGKLIGGEFTGRDVKEILYEILSQIEDYTFDLDDNYGFGYIYHSNLSKIGIDSDTYNAQYYFDDIVDIIKDRLNNLYNVEYHLDRDDIYNLNDFNFFGLYNLWNRWGFRDINRDLLYYKIRIDSAVFFILIQLFKQTNGEYYDLHNFTCLTGIDDETNNKRNFTKPYHWQFKYPEIPRNRLDYKFGSECELDKCENNRELDERLSVSPFKRVEDNPSSPYHHAIYRYSNKNGLENNRKPDHNIINYTRDSSPNFNININKTNKNNNSLVLECKTPPNRYVKINCKQGKDENGKFDGESTYNLDISIAENYADRICNGQLPGYFEITNDTYNELDYHILRDNAQEYMMQIQDYTTTPVCATMKV